VSHASDSVVAHLIGRRLRLEGHFNEPVTVEGLRPLGAGYEVRVRRASGVLDETILSPDEVQALLERFEQQVPAVALANPHHLRLLVESARIRLAYAHDRQFAVSLSGIRTLPHQVEAVYEKMLPQPRLRFLLADDPGAGKTIMAGLYVKEMKPLLDPDIFPEPHRYGDRARQVRHGVLSLSRDSPWATRRIKEDLRDINGHRLEHLAREVRSVSHIELPAETIIHGGGE
jgi:hypothetical protein